VRLFVVETCCCGPQTHVYSFCGVRRLMERLTASLRLTWPSRLFHQVGALESGCVWGGGGWGVHVAV
jgi:hypothetical protein